MMSPFAWIQRPPSLSKAMGQKATPSPSGRGDSISFADRSRKARRAPAMSAACAADSARGRSSSGAWPARAVRAAAASSRRSWARASWACR